MEALTRPLAWHVLAPGSPPSSSSVLATFPCAVATLPSWRWDVPGSSLPVAPVGLTPSLHLGFVSISCSQDIFSLLPQALRLPYLFVYSRHWIFLKSYSDLSTLECERGDASAFSYHHGTTVFLNTGRGLPWSRGSGKIYWVMNVC